MKKSLSYLVLTLLVPLVTFASTEKKLRVTASAYTSAVGETDSTPNIGAWGDKLKPGMRSIAVSRDLIELGLDHNQEVTIEGFKGTYRVLDKMNKRWTKKIDIYMGNDVESAKQWGVREVTIIWRENKDN